MDLKLFRQCGIFLFFILIENDTGIINLYILQFVG